MRQQCRNNRPTAFVTVGLLVTAIGCAAGGGTIVDPPAVRSVTVAPTTLSLAVGGQAQPLIASTDVAGGADKTVTWSSSDPSVAQVVANGQAAMVSGVKPGIAWIVATATADASKRDSAKVTVTAGTVKTITISASATAVVAFSTLQVQAVATDAAGNPVSDAALVWTSSDPAIATVSPTGLVTGKSPGTVTLTASLGTVTSNAVTLTVTNPPVASVTLSASSTTLMAFSTVQVQAVVKDAAGNALAGVPVVWASSAPDIATVSSSGVVSGKRPGTVSITAAAGAIISNPLTLTVVNPSVASITISAGTTTLVTSTTLQVQADVRDAGGNVLSGVALTWASGFPAVATVSPTGLVTGVSPGATSIAASAGAVTSNLLSLTVVSAPVASITVTPNPTSVVSGTTRQFTAVGRDAGGNVVAISPVWSVAAAAGTINSSGLFTATGAGTYTVTASAGGVTGSASVTVTAGPLATITVTPNPVTLQLGVTQQFTAAGADAAGNTVTITPVWSVVASGGTINLTGLFTAGSAAGTYTNTVKATSGSISGTATVTVTTPGPLATITVTPNPVTLALSGMQTFTAVGKDAFANTVVITPVWSVVAGGGTINSSSGLFTAGTVAGTYANTVKATSGSISGTATVTVNPGPLATITVTPNPGSVQKLMTLQFLAVGKDASGNTVIITPAPTWSVVAGGGTINASSGLFTAGTVAATFANTVKATSGSISGTATVTVTP